MAKPVILAVDDDPRVLRPVGRDLRCRYEEYRVLRADPDEPVLQTPGKPKLHGVPSPSFSRTRGYRGRRASRHSKTPSGSSPERKGLLHWT